MIIYFEQITKYFKFRQHAFAMLYKQQHSQQKQRSYIGCITASLHYLDIGKYLQDNYENWYIGRELNIMTILKKIFRQTCHMPFCEKFQTHFPSTISLNFLYFVLFIFLNFSYTNKLFKVNISSFLSFEHPKVGTIFSGIYIEIALQN